MKIERIWNDPSFIFNLHNEKFPLQCQRSNFHDYYGFVMCWQSAMTMEIIINSIKISWPFENYSHRQVNCEKRIVLLFFSLRNKFWVYPTITTYSGQTHIYSVLSRNTKYNFTTYGNTIYVSIKCKKYYYIKFMY